jgi:hypothetical protein
MHTITIRRKTSRAVHPDILLCQIDELIRKSLVGARGRWHCVKRPIREDGESGNHTYQIQLEFYRQRAAPDEDCLNEEFLTIKNRLRRAGASTTHGDNPWELVEYTCPSIEVEPDRNYSRYRIKVNGQLLDDYNYDRETARSIASALSKYQRIAHA